MKKAGVQLLEPILKVEVVTPEDHMGDVIGDLNSRRGVVQEFTDKPGGMKVRVRQRAAAERGRGGGYMGEQGGRSKGCARAAPPPCLPRVRPLLRVPAPQLVKANVPLSEMFNYVSTLRGMSKGRAQYTMQLDRYDVTPNHITELIVKSKSGSQVA